MGGEGKAPKPEPRKAAMEQAVDVMPLDVLLSVTTMAKQYMTRNAYAMLVQVVKGRLKASVSRPGESREEFNAIASQAISADIGPLRLEVLKIAEKDATVK